MHRGNRAAVAAAASGESDLAAPSLAALRLQRRRRPRIAMQLENSSPMKPGKPALCPAGWHSRRASGEDWFAGRAARAVVRDSAAASIRGRSQIAWRGESQALDPRRRPEQQAAGGRTGAASAEAAADAVEAMRTVILRMNRGEAGGLSGRLAAVTGQHDLYTPFHWKRWLGRQQRAAPRSRICAVPSPACVRARRCLLDRSTRFADLEA